jgi:hypothetical protein
MTTCDFAVLAYCTLDVCKETSNINSFEGIKTSTELLHLSDCVHELRSRLGTIGNSKGCVELN